MPRKSVCGLANAMAAQGMLWQTSPAVTEVEQVMVRWLAQALGLPADDGTGAAGGFTGTIHGVTLERLSEPSPEVRALIEDAEFRASLAVQ